MHITDIKPNRHYLENHQKDVPWDKVVELILKSKQKRKKKDKIEIKIEGVYILCKLENKILWVINAKKEGK